MIYRCPYCRCEIFKVGRTPNYRRYPCVKCSTVLGDTIYMEPVYIKGVKMPIEKLTTKDDGVLREFDTGATRDTADGKLDPEGFTHPLVMRQFYKYMNMNRLQSDGKLRDSDNWQKGIPLEAYMKSLKRHCDDLWLEHRGYQTPAGKTAAICGIMFNAMGYMHEIFKDGQALQDFDGKEPTPEMQERLELLKDLQRVRGRND